MLSGEWRDLEFMAKRLTRLREQYAANLREANAAPGVTEGLRRDIRELQQQHDQLLARISRELAASVA